MARRELDQRKRAIALLIELCLLLAICYLGFGYIFPPFSESGLWFYAALINLLLGNRLISPFFTKPVDAISYSVAAGLAILAVETWGTWGFFDKAVFTVSLAYVCIVLAMGFLAILLKDSPGGLSLNVSQACRIALEFLGSPQAVFSVVIGFSAVVFHRLNAQELLSIVIAWSATVVLSPIEGILKFWARISELRSENSRIPMLGLVAAYQTPGVILVRQENAGEIKAGSTILVKDEHLGIKSAVVLDYVGRDHKLLIRALELEKSNFSAELLRSIAQNLDDGAAITVDKGGISSENTQTVRALTEINHLVGIVATETSLERMAFEVTKPSDLEEGRLVETFINERPVIYQIVNGMTKEEVVAHKNSYGYVRAEARKIGQWNNQDGRFQKVPWLPSLNCPVFLHPKAVFTVNSAVIGHFPSSQYGVRVDDINSLVTHNTAILGILGVGKSMLSVELVERMIASGIKVICLDLTNQYAKELSPYIDSEFEDLCKTKIVDAGQKDAERWKDNPEEGGSLPHLREAIFDDLQEFLKPENPRLLKIYNPASIAGTKQDSEPKNYQVAGKWQRGAVLWSVTSVEITRLVSESALAILQDKMTDVARCCLVFEEAHSLVPEWNTAVSDGDKAATNGTARAILQGRKYGLGCLVISQRTASVTKTILNQCNTIFAMRTFDETGMEFLGNYLGKDYARLLPSLAERQAVFFGKASSCENPVLIRLNDRGNFISTFRSQYPPANLPTLKDTVVDGADSVPTSGGQLGDMKDDIPF